MTARAAIEVVVQLTEIVCGRCSGVYAISERVREFHFEHGTFWHCPYCQTDWGYAKGRVRQLEEQLSAERARTQAALSRENEARQRAEAAEAANAKARKRAQAGVCLCCNRSFVNLRRHMAAKHPPAALGRVR